MTETKELTLDYVSALLRKRNMITEEQEREIRIKGEAQSARLRKSQESFYSSRRRLP